MDPNPLHHPGAAQIPETDVEKRGELKPDIAVTTKEGERSSSTSSPSGDAIRVHEDHDIAPTPELLKGPLGRLNAWVEGLAGLEARGIVRVLPEERHQGGARGYLQMFLLWLSINLTATNIIVGLLGPLVYFLGWKDCVLISIFSQALVACAPAFTATFGPVSGNRTMVLGRYWMGYWPAKLAAILNIINQVGFGTLGCIIAGQMLSAVNGKGLTIAVGCVISALGIGLLAIFGIAIVHAWERYAYIPQAVVIFVLIGSAAKNFDVHAPSVGTDAEITASRCSFFALCVGSVAGFAAISADFYVYYPVTTSKKLTFAMTWLGSWLPIMFLNIVGIGIATGVAKVPSWGDAYAVSSGALLLQGYEGLGGFGGFCVVILALGSITNNAPASYVAANSVQVLGRYGKALPRWFWCVVIMIIELVLSVAGRNHLFTVFENFLPLTSYWVCPWLMIVVEEHLLFHVLPGIPYDWAAWEDKKRLPVGAAALFAWLVGWAGAIIGMAQVWYTGPVAAKIGGYGGDIGQWMSIAFAGIMYPGLRYYEKKIFFR